MRCGSGGVAAGLGSLNIAIPPILSHGTDEQKERFVKPVIMGDKIAALAITEPGGGSDVAGLQTTAVRENDHYVVNGSKTFITSGCRADQITCAVRTGGPGAQGISLLVMEAGTPGYSVSEKLKKTGWWASDTARFFSTIDAVQIFGGYGFMRGYPVERLYRDNRVLSIGGGTTEIMKEIISKYIL
jgi:acyl-CoA dehydrogenase